MTDPSQYFKGRTVQEQMDEVIGYVDTRAAEVATAAIASDVAQVHQDMLDADADATAAAASAAAAAGTLANAVKKTGEASQSIAGDIVVAGDLTGGTVTVPTPVNNTDAASKKYVDDADALKLNITDVNTYAVGLTGNQTKSGILTLSPVSRYPLVIKNTADSINTPPSTNQYSYLTFSDGGDNRSAIVGRLHTTGGSAEIGFEIVGENGYRASLGLRVNSDGTGYLRLNKPNGTSTDIVTW